MHNPALEMAAKDFETWRSNRNKHARIPLHLLVVIQELHKTTAPNQIAKALGLKEARVIQILGTPNSENISFVELPKKLWDNSAVLCTLQRSDGAKLIIEVGTQELNSLIQVFLCCK